MAKKMTLGVDFGGSSSKATLIDEEGKVLATSTKEYTSYYPASGWVEQDPIELYEAFVYNVRNILQKSKANPEDIAALAIDAATHMAIYCDENDQPVYRMLHWSDTRASQEAAYIRENYNDIVKKYSCNTVSAGWNLPQIFWLKKNEPEVFAKIKKIYFCKDYIRHCVTGDFYTDEIEIMGSMWADDNTGTWSDELCALAGIKKEMLPEIKKPTDIAGNVSAKAAAETGLSTKTAVIIGSTDTVMEVLASGAVELGQATIKLATAGRICPICTSYVKNPFFFNYKHVVPGLWYPGTGTRSCATSYKWFRDTFGDLEKVVADKVEQDPYDILNAQAIKVPAGSQGLIYHPYLNGEMTPYNDDKLCASFTGVRLFHTKGHFARAVMEGVSYSMKDSLEEIRRMNVKADSFRAIGGGAKSPLWSQILADVLGEPLIRTQNNDSSLGSAMLAGVASGMFKSFQDSVDRCVVVSGKVEPNLENVKVYEKGFDVYKQIQKALQTIYDNNY